MLDNHSQVFPIARLKEASPRDWFQTSFHERLEKSIFFICPLQGQTYVTQMLASPNHNETFSWKPPHRGDPRALRVTASWYFLPSESNKEGDVQGGVRERKGKGEMIELYFNFKNKEVG